MLRTAPMCSKTSIRHSTGCLLHPAQHRMLVQIINKVPKEVSEGPQSL